SSISRAKPPSRGALEACGLSVFFPVEAVDISSARPTGRQGKVMATTTDTANSDVAGEDGVRRRDFIEIAAVSAAGVGGLIAVLPLVSQMAPSKDVLAESTTELDISTLE